MIKHEIIEKISKYFKLTEFEAEKVYDDIFLIIMNGVKEDNIVDVTNFGEFIIKYNNGKSNNTGNANSSGSEYRKTVEFLSSSSLEEELNQSIIGEEPGTYKSEETTQTPPVVEEATFGSSTFEPPAAETPTDEPPKVESLSVESSSVESPVVEPPAVEKPISEGSSIEEELRRKREEILSRITGPILQVPPILSLGQKEEKPVENPEPEKIEKEAPAEDITEAPVTPVKEEHEEIKDSDVRTVEKETEEQVDELSQKSFSDYFSEVSGETKPVTTPEPLKELEKDVIPKSAVLLHNEIVGASEPPKTPLKEEPVKTQTQPVSETTVQPEHRAEDNSYYIWYKDSDSNPTDTQALSYEYELLYQATKEAEYKSKLRIYVTTFILFFSIVLLLLIFSPLIYKFFFTPEEFQQNIEKTQEPPPDVSEQKGTPNVIPENNMQSEQNQVQPPQDTSSQKQKVQNLQTEQQTPQQNPPVKNEEKQITKETSKQQKQEEKEQEQKKQEQQKLEQKKQEQQKKEQEKQEQKKQELQKKEQQKPPVEKKTEGLVKNSMGWMDDKNKVIYIQLESGKYTIQESAWDSESKASKRLSTIESLGISGLKGNIIRADLGAKGIWFRARFGEFSSLEEARKKAEDLRRKEKVKLHAMLAYLFLYT
jgi:nucleoid DNA-binding protein